MEFSSVPESFTSHAPSAQPFALTLVQPAVILHLGCYKSFLTPRPPLLHTVFLIAAGLTLASGPLHLLILSNVLPLAIHITRPLNSFVSLLKLPSQGAFPDDPLALRTVPCYYLFSLPALSFCHFLSLHSIELIC